MQLYNAEIIEAPQDPRPLSRTLDSVSLPDAKQWLSAKIHAPRSLKLQTMRHDPALRQRPWWNSRTDGIAKLRAADGPCQIAIEDEWLVRITPAKEG